MGILSKSQFATECGVAPAAITYAVKKGLVVLDGGGNVDPEHPVNSQYIRGKKEGIKAPGEGGRRKPGGTQRRKVRTPEQPPESEDLEEDPLQLQKLRAEVRLKNEQADYYHQRRLERLGKLVEKSLVDQMIAKLGAELRTRILDLPRRVGPQVHAMVQSGSEAREVEEYLERELSDAIKRAKEAARRAGLDSI